MPYPPLARYVDIRPINLFFLRVFNESLRVSAFFLMELENKKLGSNGVFIFSDAGMIQNPTSEELVDIAYASSKSFRIGEKSAKKSAKFMFSIEELLNVSGKSEASVAI